MAGTTLQGATGPDQSRSGDRDLIISLNLDSWVQFEGAAADLIAEGLIPHDFEWPRAAADKRWEANGFRYWLRRTRPADLKGPMRTWLEMDNWFIRIEVTGRDAHWISRQRLKRQADELAAAHQRYGSAEWNDNLNRISAAFRDEKFQAFKSVFMPERKTRARKAGAQVPEGAPPNINPERPLPTNEDAARAAEEETDMPTMQQPKRPSSGPSPKLRQMLRDATPEQIEAATRVAAKLLVRKAAKKRTQPKP